MSEMPIREAIAVIVGQQVHRGRGEPRTCDECLKRADAILAEIERRSGLGGLQGQTIRGWAQWVDDENWLFEVTNNPSAAQTPATLVLAPDTWDEAAASASGAGING